MTMLVMVTRTTMKVLMVMMTMMMVMMMVMVTMLLTMMVVLMVMMKVTMKPEVQSPPFPTIPSASFLSSVLKKHFHFNFFDLFFCFSCLVFELASSLL